MPRPTASPSGAPITSEPENNRRRYSTSAVTRLLCVGAQVDPAFCDAVIKELIETDDLVDGQQRVVAPSYGYDVLPVLGHALHARARRRYRFWTSAVTFCIPLILLFTAGFTIAFVGFLVWFWFLWMVNFLDQLAILRILTDQLRAPDEQTGKHFDGRVPYHHQLFENDTFQRIALEQDPSSEVVYYGGYQPFVGAGHHEKTAAFPILLNGAPDGLPLAGEPITRKAVRPFTSVEMMDHISARLKQVLLTDPQIGTGVEGLEISRRYYRTAVGRVRPAPAATIDPASVKDEGYAAAREYLCVRVGSWEEELVASVFINFDVRGNTLYTEIHSYVLHPVNGAYRQADRLPETISQQDLWKIALHALGRAVRSVVIGIEAVLRVFGVRGKVRRSSLRWPGLRAAGARNAGDPSADQRFRRAFQRAGTGLRLRSSPLLPVGGRRQVPGDRPASALRDHGGIPDRDGRRHPRDAGTPGRHSQLWNRADGRDHQCRHGGRRGRSDRFQGRKGGGGFVSNEGIIQTGGTINAGVMAAGRNVSVSGVDGRATDQAQGTNSAIPNGTTHRTIVCVDVKSFGDQARTNTHQVAVRDGLYRALRTAFGQARIPWDTCYHEDRGDGALILVPAETPKRDVIAVPANLVGALEAHNQLYATPAQIKLRMAVHAGEVRHDEHGVAGTAVNHAFRLLEAAPLKLALDEATHPLALIVSDWFFTEVIRHDLSARPDTYIPAQVTTKETSTTGWMRTTFE